MATKDFKANRIRLQTVISKENTSVFPNVSVLSSESLIDANSESLIHQNVGTDTFIFVSGSIGSAKVADSRGTAVFGGDVVISGSLNIENGVQGLAANYDKKVMSIFDVDEDNLDSLLPGNILKNTDNAAFFVEIVKNDFILIEENFGVYQFNLVPTIENEFDDKYFFIDDDGNMSLRKTPVDTVSKLLPLVSIQS
jgi:hypothetical protein